MNARAHDASARHHSGEPSPVPGRGSDRNDCLRGPDLSDLECEIAGLIGQSTQELRRAWQTLHHTGPPLGLSRDLIIRGLSDKLQQRAHAGPTRALQRRLRILAAEFEKGARSFDPGIVLKTGATLVRQWRGHTHTVLVGEDGFEYEGQRYRSLRLEGCSRCESKRNKRCDGHPNIANRGHGSPLTHTKTEARPTCPPSGSYHATGGRRTVRTRHHPQVANDSPGGLRLSGHGCG